MALFALAGIPWLAGLIGGLFTSLFTFFASYMTKRFAILVTAIAVIVGLTTTLFNGLYGLVGALNLLMPPELLGALGHVMPSGGLACVTVLLTAKMARYAYDWNIKIIQYKLF